MTSWWSAARAAFVDALGTMGRLDGSLYLASRVLERASGGRMRIVKYHIVAQPIATAAQLRHDGSTALMFCRPADPIAAVFPRPAAVIERRFAQGAQCLVAIVKQRFAGFLWLQHRRYEEDEVRCTYLLDPARHCVWDFDVYVDPAYRHGRTLARLWQAANEHLTASGVRWTCSRISAFNPASLAAHARLGAVTVDHAVFFVFGPWQLAIFSGTPFVHLSFGPGRVPGIAVRPPA